MNEEPSGGVVGPPEPRPLGDEVALREEKTRGRITNWTLGIFALTILGGFVGVYTGHWDETRELLDIIVPVEAILIGGVGGYYLGTGTTP